MTRLAKPLTRRGFIGADVANLAQRTRGLKPDLLRARSLHSRNR